MFRYNRNVIAWAARKIIYIVLGCVAAVAFAAVAYICFIVYYYTVPVAIYVETTGTVGDVTIGENKKSILARLGNSKQSFSPEPKPQECPVNWIDVSDMSQIQRNCLLKTDHWQEGYPSTKALCPEHTNVFTDLRFTAGSLYSVTTTCRHPE